jgi:hypothetical protein
MYQSLQSRNHVNSDTKKKTPTDCQSTVANEAVETRHEISTAISSTFDRADWPHSRSAISVSGDEDIKKFVF